MDEHSVEFHQLSLLASVGNALSAWSIVELQMSKLFILISDIRHHLKPEALFNGIVSFEVRLSILDRLMALDGAEAVEAEMWTRLSGRLSKFYKKRHELAHFTLVSGPPQTIAPFLNMADFVHGRHRELSLSQVTERSGKFDELSKAVDWFHFRAFQRRWPPEGDLLPEREEPPLVPQLRDLAVQSLAKR